MLQVIQHQNTGKMSVEDLPDPQLEKGSVLIQNRFSLISAGTERSSVETAKASIVGKAKKRPDLVKQVINSVKREGLITTYKKVQNRLDNYIQLGYSSAGVVLKSDVPEFHPGDRVACAGAGYASHAETIIVPKNLVAKVPENVDLQSAAFCTVASIALQGVRQAEPRIGESIVVIGLGLIGLITVQLLKANGCRVIGLDVSPANFEKAKEFGCDECLISNFEAVEKVHAFTRGNGADSIIITAATKSNQPLELSLELARKKAHVVVVGAVGMDIPRSPFYEKELDLRIASSYGPGRYDPQYEEKGNDYPIGYVRWTENRNMIAILDLLEQNKLDFKSMVSHTFPIEKALEAYDLVTGKTEEKYLGILLQYPEQNTALQRIHFDKNSGAAHSVSKQVIGFIGAGNFAQSYLIPPLKKQKVQLEGVITATPINSKSVAEKFGFNYAATNPDQIFEDENIHTVFIATQHDTHGKFVLKALQSGKNVFVEKPLAISRDELDKIAEAYTSSNMQIAIGFNRRFSAPFRYIKSAFGSMEKPLVINYRVNAGFIPDDHWTQDPAQGGRIIGEGCHFIDIFNYLTDAKPVSIYASSAEFSDTQMQNNDTVSIVIKYSDGSIGNLTYLANGDASVPKEYCEVYGGGKTAIMDDFKKVYLHQNNGSKKKSFSGGKGHSEEIDHFLNVMSGTKDQELPFESIYDTTLLTFLAMESIKTGKVISLSD